MAAVASAALAIGSIVAMASSSGPDEPEPRRTETAGVAPTPPAAAAAGPTAASPTPPDEWGMRGRRGDGRGSSVRADGQHGPGVLDRVLAQSGSGPGPSSSTFLTETTRATRDLYSFAPVVASSSRFPTLAYASERASHDARVAQWASDSARSRGVAGEYGAGEGPLVNRGLSQRRMDAREMAAAAREAARPEEPTTRRSIGCSVTEGAVCADATGVGGRAPMEFLAATQTRRVAPSARGDDAVSHGGGGPHGAWPSCLVDERAPPATRVPRLGRRSADGPMAVAMGWVDAVRSRLYSLPPKTTTTTRDNDDAGSPRHLRRRAVPTGLDARRPQMGAGAPPCTWTREHEGRRRAFPSPGPYPTRDDRVGRSLPGDDREGFESAEAPRSRRVALRARAPPPNPSADGGVYGDTTAAPHTRRVAGAAMSLSNAATLPTGSGLAAGAPSPTSAFGSGQDDGPSLRRRAERTSPPSDPRASAPGGWEAPCVIGGAGSGLSRRVAPGEAAMGPAYAGWDAAGASLVRIGEAEGFESAGAEGRRTLRGRREGTRPADGRHAAPPPQFSEAVGPSDAAPARRAQDPFRRGGALGSTWSSPASSGYAPGSRAPAPPPLSRRRGGEEEGQDFGARLADSRGAISDGVLRAYVDAAEWSPSSPGRGEPRRRAIPEGATESFAARSASSPLAAGASDVLGGAEASATAQRALRRRAAPESVAPRPSSTSDVGRGAFVGGGGSGVGGAVVAYASRRSAIDAPPVAAGSTGIVFPSDAPGATFGAAAVAPPSGRRTDPGSAAPAPVPSHGASGYGAPGPAHEAAGARPSRRNGESFAGGAEERMAAGPARTPVSGGRHTWLDAATPDRAREGGASRRSAPATQAVGWYSGVSSHADGATGAARDVPSPPAFDRRRTAPPGAAAPGPIAPFASVARAPSHLDPPVSTRTRKFP